MMNRDSRWTTILTEKHDLFISSYSDSRICARHVEPLQQVFKTKCRYESLVSVLWLHLANYKHFTLVDGDFVALFPITHQ